MGRALAPGTMLGNYRIEQLVGRGGSGAVFLAHDVTLHRKVALKLLDEDRDDETSRGQLLREARNAAALNHPNICTIHEVGSADGAAFIAMEYVGERSLADRIRDTEGLPPGELLRFGIEAAEALAYAHSHGVVHRDFKAANAMITEDGRIKVVDFGLARRSDALMTEASTIASIVPDGTVAGTPYAMAPEQVRGEVADARTDLWALGVLLYEMASGAKPFAGATAAERFASILTAAPAPLPATVPPALQRVIDRCLEKDPARRYVSATEVRDALIEVEAGKTQSPTGLRPRMRRRSALAAAAILVLAAAALVGNVGGVRERLLGASASGPITIMVRPFANLTGDPGQEFFSDGLTDEMITQLGRLRPERLRVIGRSSAMSFKSRDASLDAIGRELGVDYVLEGSARREGSRVRISAALIQVRDGTQSWADSFDREVSGILALQNDIARGIVEALSLNLLPADTARLTAARQVNPQAYEAYLLGQSHARRLTRPELDRALEYYESALKLDPRFALAYHGIGGVWAARVQIGLVTRADEAGRGKAALLQAISLDDSLPEVHMALANERTWVDWDWTAAEQSFRRALDLNPSLAEAHAFYAHYLFIVGRPDEGAASMERALALDPLNDLIQQFYGQTLRWTGRYEEGIVHAQQVLQTSPNSPSAWGALTDNLYSLGRYEESLAAQRRALGAREAPEIAEAMTRGYAESGYRGAMLRSAEARGARGQSWVAAQLYMRAGQPDRALDWLERAYEDRNQNLPYARLFPVFSGVHNHPRFQTLMRLMQLPST